MLNDSTTTAVLWGKIHGNVGQNELLTISARNDWKDQWAGGRRRKDGMGFQ